MGICYAIGVILDGRHNKLSGEDISRGARHNSAYRYVFEKKHNCVAIIISEDGDVTLVD